MTDAHNVRLLALWRDDPTEAPMTVDLRIDGVRLASPWDLFGAFDLDGPGCRPFVLRRDGAIDFGAGQGERWRTNLREAELKVGARFVVWWNDADGGAYQIVKIAVLGAKDRSR